MVDTMDNKRVFPEGISRYNVVLASGSPRRRELMEMLGLEFEVYSLKNADESYSEMMEAEEVPEYLSRKKAAAYLSERMRQGDLAVTSDTVVIVDNEVLGKPKDEADAYRMLKLLSGRTHKVVTGVAVTDGKRVESTRSVTTVEFSELSEEEIRYYIERYRPLDKAGAYGIQEWIGCIGIKRIEGSFYNVMGLPVHVLYNLLKEFLKK